MAEGGGEVAGREILRGQEIGDVFAKLFGGEGLVVFAGMERAEIGMSGLERVAALAGVGEGEGAEVLARRGYRSGGDRIWGVDRACR